MKTLTLAKATATNNTHLARASRYSGRFIVVCTGMAVEGVSVEHTEDVTCSLCAAKWKAIQNQTRH